MAQQWPTTAPSVSPGTHDPVATQAYQAGGGDYFRSGFYYTGVSTAGSMTTVVPAVGQLVLVPFMVPVRRSFDRIGVNVTVAGSAGAVVRLGVYQAAAFALVLDAGTAATTTTGAKEITISLTLDPGLHFLAMVPQTNTATYSAFTGSTVTPYVARGTTPPTTTAENGVMHQTGQTGALPATAAPSWNTFAAPAVALRAA